jgi:hypothetical protein
MIRKCMLSPGRRDLIDLMFEIYYGQIENLVVCGGEPMLTPAPRIVRDVRLGRREVKRTVRNRRDFTLKAQLVDLFNHLDAIRDGVIDRIEIQAGLPFRIRVAKAA